MGQMLNERCEFISLIGFGFGSIDSFSLIQRLVIFKMSSSQQKAVFGLWFNYLSLNPMSTAMQTPIRSENPWTLTQKHQKLWEDSPLMWALTSPVDWSVAHQRLKARLSTKPQVCASELMDLWVQQAVLKKKSASLGKLGFSSLSVIGIILTQTRLQPVLSITLLKGHLHLIFYLCLNRKK